MLMFAVDHITPNDLSHVTGTSSLQYTIPSTYQNVMKTRNCSLLQKQQEQQQQQQKQKHEKQVRQQNINNSKTKSIKNSSNAQQSCSICSVMPNHFLQHEWKSAYDSYGRVYYYDTVTRQSSWSLPRHYHCFLQKNTNSIPYQYSHQQKQEQEQQQQQQQREQQKQLKQKENSKGVKEYDTNEFNEDSKEKEKIVNNVKDIAEQTKKDQEFFQIMEKNMLNKMVIATNENTTNLKERSNVNVKSQDEDASMESENNLKSNIQNGKRLFQTIECLNEDYVLSTNLNRKLSLYYCDNSSNHHDNRNHQKNHIQRTTENIRQSRAFRTLSSLDDLSVQSYYKQAYLMEDRNAIVAQPSLGSKCRSFSRLPNISHSLENDTIIRKRVVVNRPRSNSTSTMYMRMGTMTLPNQKAIMYCVSSVIHRHIMHSLQRPIVIRSKFQPFHSYGISNNQMPSVMMIYRLMKFVFHRAQIESQCLIITLIYLERMLLMTEGDFQLLPSNWLNVLFISIILASKVWDDLTMLNADFSKVYPVFSLQRINQLEALFLESIKYNVHVSAASYAKYYFHLRTLTQDPQIADGIRLVSQNEKDKTKNERNDEDESIKMEGDNQEEEEKPMSINDINTNNVETRRRFSTVGDCMSIEEIHKYGYKYSYHRLPSASLEQVVQMQVTKAGDGH